MEAAAGPELQVGSVVPVLLEQMVNDSLVVTLSCGEKRYSGILLDCTKKSKQVPPGGSCHGTSSRGRRGASVT